MSEELKTIKELADELCISKQGVQYHLNYYHLKTRKKNKRGIIILTHEEQDFVRNRVGIQSTKETSTKGISAKETSAKKTSAKGISAKEISAKETSAKKTSAKGISAKEISAKKTSAKGISAKGISAKETHMLLEKIKMQEIQIEDFKQQRERQDTQINVKDKQLENKDSQILQMQNLLDQQQRLALQDKKLLEEYKSEIKNLKALNIPREDMKEEQLVNDVQKEGETIKKQPKKWWHFGRK